MSAAADWNHLQLTDLARRIRGREVSPVEAARGPSNAISARRRTPRRSAGRGGDPGLVAPLLRFARPFDMTGGPTTTTLPGGSTGHGTPAAFQGATDRHRRHPPV